MAGKRQIVPLFPNFSYAQNFFWKQFEKKMNWKKSLGFGVLFSAIPWGSYSQCYYLLPSPNPRWNSGQILAETSRRMCHRTSPCLIKRVCHRTSPCLRGCVMGHHRTSLTKGARIARAACNYPTYITLAEEPTHPFERIYFYLNKLFEDLSQNNLFE